MPVSQPSPQPNRPSPSPGKVTTGDPFAALDAKSPAPGGDELSSRFPTLDQFSLLHDKGQKFNFDSSQPAAAQQQSKDLSQRVAERLADEAFQVKPSPSTTPAQPSQRQSMDVSRANLPVLSPPLKSATAPPQPEVSRASAIISNTPELQALSSQTSPTPSKPVMVSIGTMTSPSLDLGPQYQINRFPPAPADHHRAASVPRSSVTGQHHSSLGDNSAPVVSRTPSFQGIAQSPHLRYPSSSRPSLEGGRPSLEQLDSARPKSRLASKPRPVSTHLESNLDFLREQESRSRSPALPSPRQSMERSLPPSPDEDKNIESNVDFLRSMEDSEPKKKDKGHKHHLKRGSLSSLGAGTKNILAGKFGDAFKRFESSSNGPPRPRTPSPLKDGDRRDLTPIAGSEAVDGRSDDGQPRDWEDMTPEMRREQEARMLAQEEARVAAAQAEYRQRVGQRGGAGGAPVPPPKSIGGVSRVASIQNKVQSLIEESNRSSTGVTRTAQGYGPYSDAAHAAAAPKPSAGGDGRPVVPRKPLGATSAQVTGSQQRPSTSSGNTPVVETSTTGRTAAASASTTGGGAGAGRPMAPPKPTHLNKPLPPVTGGSGRAPSPTKQMSLPLMPNPANSRGISSPKIRGGGQQQALSGGVGSEALLAVDLPGGGGSALLKMTAAEKEDYIRDFQKRFPSLGSIEMVERDLAAEDAGGPGRR